MGTPQLSYSQNPAEGRAGAISDCSIRDVVSVWIAAAMTSGVAPGLLLVRDADGEAITPAGQAEDDDALIATIGSTAGIQTFDTAGEFDGVVSLDRIAVPAKVTLTLSNHTDWDATNAVFTGVNDEGVTVSENLAIPDGGNDTITSTGRYVQAVSLVIPAQTGTGGTATLGFAASDAITSEQIHGVAVYDPSQEDPETLAADTMAGAMRRGRIWVPTESQVAEGQRAYVRVNATGDEVLGSWRKDTDSGDAVLVPGARFRRVASSTLAELEVDFTG